MNTEPLKKLIAALTDKLTRATGSPVSTDEITLSFNSRGGWSWICLVDAKKKPHGRGLRVTRDMFTGYGNTPREAVDDILRKISIPGYLDIL